MNDLPPPNEPLVLRDGTKIDPLTGKRVREQSASISASVIQLPSAKDAVRVVTRARRKLADLPAPPRASNALSVVLQYTLIGLNDEDIAIATDLTIDQVTRMRSLPAYAELERAVTKAILERDTDDVRDFFSQNARHAAQRVMDSTNSNDDAVALRASFDVLDRAGHRPADVVEHRHRMEGGLTIEIIERSAADDVPSVTIDKGV